MAEYLIQSETLTAIADAIRAKKETTAVFTLEQMAVEIESLAMGNELPSAEDGAFGKSSEEYGYGLESATLSGAVDNPWTVGYQFVPAESFAVVGFRIYRKTGAHYAVKSPLRLWDSSNRVLAEVEVNTQTGEWFAMYLDKPVNVTVGETYRIGCYADGYTYSESWTANPKISNILGCYYMGNGVPDSTHDRNIFGMYDIIIAPVQAELPDTYKVERTTMDDIAVEVQRISGISEKMTPEQILTALESVTT